MEAGCTAAADDHLQQQQQQQQHPAGLVLPGSTGDDDEAPSYSPAVLPQLPPSGLKPKRGPAPTQLQLHTCVGSNSPRNSNPNSPSCSIPAAVADGGGVGGNGSSSVPCTPPALLFGQHEQQQGGTGGLSPSPGLVGGQGRLGLRGLLGSAVAAALFDRTPEASPARSPEPKGPSSRGSPGGTSTAPNMQSGVACSPVQSGPPYAYSGDAAGLPAATLPAADAQDADVVEPLQCSLVVEVVGSLCQGVVHQGGDGGNGREIGPSADVGDAVAASTVGSCKEHGLAIDEGAGVLLRAAAAAPSTPHTS
jgi:hypothetical protein